MKLNKPYIAKLFRGLLVVLTIALVIVEANLLFAEKNTEAYAQNVDEKPRPLLAQNVSEGGPPGQGGQAGEPTVSSIDPSKLEEEQKKCLDMMTNFVEGREDPITFERADGVQKKFTEDINQNFCSNKNTSELLPYAFERLRKYQETLFLELNNFTYRPGALVAAAVNEDGPCRGYVEDNLRQVRSLLYSHVMENAQAKKSTRLLDKYKSINDQLADLNMEVAQMYANFSIFSQKLPCYARECVK